MDSGIISGIVTAIFIAVFIGIVWWAYSKGNKQRFEEDARMPFEESDTPPNKEKSNE
jgi:cytochrome c oxidase cbb3-type subunit 4